MGYNVVIIYNRDFLGKGGCGMGGKRDDHGRKRIWVLVVVCCAVFGLFLARLIQMQFFLAGEYAAKVQAAATAVYTVSLPAARGAITDRNGTVLARDGTVFDLYLRVPAPPGTDLETTLNQLEPLLGGKDVETQLAAFCSAVSAGELLVGQGITGQQLAGVYAAGLVQQGAVRLSARGSRSWPDGTLLPHALGFTGPVTAEQWQADREALLAAGVRMDSVIGQSGLEAAYDALLRGQDGTLRVRAGLDGALLSQETVATPEPGATLVLTIDAGLQAALQTALRDQIATLQATKAAGKGREACAGAAVVVDVRTGGILAAANWPGYDLATYRQRYAELAADTAAPLLDRVCSGLYAPGSAFKPAVAAAALASGTVTPEDTVYCGGTYRFYPVYQPGCLQYGHAGAVDLRTALEHSCNIYFYDVGRRLGVDAFSAMAQTLGLAADTGAELAQAAGRLTWSDDGNYQAGLVLQAAIGQGNTALTPLQLAAYAAALANGGTRPALHFASHAVDAAGETVWQYPAQVMAQAAGGEQVFGPIQEGMRRMAQTLRVLRESPVPCAAKTGSPQLPGTLPNGEHYTNSVLIGYAPVEDPRVAVAVVLEYGGGGSNAAPVLRAVLDALPADFLG